MSILSNAHITPPSTLLLQASPTTALSVSSSTAPTASTPCWANMVEPPVQQFGQMGVSPTAPVRLDRAPTPEEVLEFGEPTNGAWLPASTTWRHLSRQPHQWRRALLRKCSGLTTGSPGSMMPPDETFGGNARVRRPAFEPAWPPSSGAARRLLSMAFSGRCAAACCS